MRKPTMIVKRVRLVGEMPMRPSTRIGIDLPSDDLRFGIYYAKTAEDCKTATIHWGDGTSETAASLAKAIHTYPRPGRYVVRIEDHLAAISFSQITEGEFRAFPPRIVSFVSDAQRLTTLYARCFWNATNLRTLDVRDAAITTLSTHTCSGCTALTGELAFPRVNMISGASTGAPFYNCTGLTAIHFAAENEDKVRLSSACRSDPTLGTGKSDILQFDL